MFLHNSLMQRQTCATTWRKPRRRRTEKNPGPPFDTAKAHSHHSRCVCVLLPSCPLLPSRRLLSSFSLGLCVCLCLCCPAPCAFLVSLTWVEKVISLFSLIVCFWLCVFGVTDAETRDNCVTKEATLWLSWYDVGLASADRLPAVVRISAGPLGSLKCDPPKGNGRRPKKKLLR